MRLPTSIKKMFGLTREALTREQASGGLTGVRKAWPDSYAGGLTPKRLASILRACDNGEIDAFMTLAEEMEERDPHYASVLGQRKRAISGIVPTVKPASENPVDQKIADWVREHIAEATFMPQLIEDLLDAVGKGFAVVEIVWEITAAEWRPAQLKWQPQRYFRPDRETGEEIRLLTDAEPIEGEPLAEGKYLQHRAPLKSGQVFRAGIARVVSFSWICKAYTLKDWAAFVELYGLPIRLGRYGEAATEKDIEVLYRAVANIGTDAAAVVPKHMDIEFVETSANGGSQPIFENLARFVDEQISKAVLGQTMTSDDGSSMAQAKVHNDVRLDIAQADARAVGMTIKRDLVAPAVRANFGQDAAVPDLIIEVAEPEDVSGRVSDIVALASAGVSFRQAEARALVRMSDPEKGDELFGGAAPKTATATAALATARLAPSAPLDDLDEIIETMLEGWPEVMAEMLGPIRAAIEDAADLPDALSRLDEIETLPQSRLINDLVIGMYQARALGDIKDG